MVEAFKSSVEFCDVKVDFGVASYVQGIADLKENVKKMALDFDLSLLESDDEEEAGEGGDEDLQVEDLFSLKQEDWRVEEVVSVPLLAIIVLFDQAEVEDPLASRS